MLFLLLLALELLVAYSILFTDNMEADNVYRDDV